MKQLRAVGQVMADQVATYSIAPGAALAVAGHVVAYHRPWLGTSGTCTGTGCTTTAMPAAKRLNSIPTHGIPATGTRRAQEPPT